MTRQSDPAGPTAHRNRTVRRIASRTRTATIAIVAAVGLTLLGSGPVFAHSELVSSDPAEGAQLSTPPATITLTFSDGVAPTYSQVTLSFGGTAPAALTTRVKGDRVVAGVPALLRVGGRWQIAYRIVSADGHPVTGRLSFRVVKQSASAGSSASVGAETESSDSSEGAPIEHADSESTNNTGLSVLVLALLMSIPVGMFVVAAYRKRREEAQEPES